jgi:hypothetical protein
MGLTANINNGTPSAQVQNTTGELQSNVLPSQQSSVVPGRDASPTITAASGNPDAGTVIVGGTSSTAAANTSDDATTTTSGNNTSQHGVGNTVVMNVGTQGSKLHIVNGGVRLPSNLTSDNGK